MDQHPPPPPNFNLDHELPIVADSLSQFRVPSPLEKCPFFTLQSLFPFQLKIKILI